MSPSSEKKKGAEAGNIPAEPASHSFEGDYRPSTESAFAETPSRVDPLQLEYLMRLADTLNTTLDLQTLLNRTSELVRSIIHYRIFAILLLNDRTNELRMRFQIGHTPEAQRMRFPLGKGVVGQVALTREAVLINDVTKLEGYINANPNVCSELAVPLIAKNRLIGVIDLESEQVGYFQAGASAPAHAHRVAHRPGNRERAPLHPRLTPG